MSDHDNMAGQVDPRFEDLPAYALGAVTLDERIRIEKLLAESADARADLAELLEGTDALAGALPDAAPPARLRRRILEAAARHAPAGFVAQRRPVTTPRTGIAAFAISWLRPARMAYAGSGIALAAAIGVAAFFGVQTSRLGTQVDDLHARMSEEHAKVSALEESLVTTSEQAASQRAEMSRLSVANYALQDALRDQRWLTYVTVSEQYQVPNWFVGNSTAPAADAQLAVRSGGNEAVLMVNGLTQPPAGFTYQLYLFRDSDGERVGQRVTEVKVNEIGQARVEFVIPYSIWKYSSAVVRLERVGDPPNPVGAEVLISNTRAVTGAP
jgi:hypothetical protein